MHPSFGIETRVLSTRWDDVRRGPCKADVCAHVRKAANYPALLSRQPAAQQQVQNAVEERRLAA